MQLSDSNVGHLTTLAVGIVAYMVAYAVIARSRTVRRFLEG